MQANQAQDLRDQVYLDQVLQIFLKVPHFLIPQKLAFLDPTLQNSLALGPLKLAALHLILPQMAPQLAPLTLALQFEFHLTPKLEILAALMNLARLFDFRLKFLGWMMFLTRDFLIPNLSLERLFPLSKPHPRHLD